MLKSNNQYNENKLILVGLIKVISESHYIEHKGQYYKIILAVPSSNSLNNDIIECFCHESVLEEVNLKKDIKNYRPINQYCSITGTIRTSMNPNNRLNVFGYIKELKLISEEDFKQTKVFNRVIINGTISKEPLYIELNKNSQKESLKHILTKTVLAVNRVMYKKADYIPIGIYDIRVKLKEEYNIIGEFKKRYFKKDNRSYSTQEVIVKKIRNNKEVAC